MNLYINPFKILLLIFAMLYQVNAHAIYQSDTYYMKEAIQLAKKNPNAPFGAVIVDNKTGKIVGKGVNTIRLNPTFHGEMMAINDCAKHNPHVNWSNLTLYTTAEPCSMCQSAIVWAGISRVVFGTNIEYLKTHGWEQIDISSAVINQKASFYKGTITGGVLTDKTDSLFDR
jgi:tRNA(adenine34) deaminase